MKIILNVDTYFRSEFLLLKDILDPFASNDKIDRHALKGALLQWTRTLKGEKDSW